MAVLVCRLDARMATVLISSLILTMINGGFHGGVVIISALDPMCGASNEWFCSPADTGISSIALGAILWDIRINKFVMCGQVYNEPPTPGVVPVAYTHYSCADANDPDCLRCLARATHQMSVHCEGKDGAQYGTEQCCARYEKERCFLGKTKCHRRCQLVSGDVDSMFRDGNSCGAVDRMHR